MQRACHLSAPTHSSRSLDLAIVVLSFNTRELLRSCLHSVLASQGSFTFCVCVVDNASSDGSAEMVRDEFSQVHLICSDRNLGYSAGNNLGLRWFGFADPDQAGAGLGQPPGDGAAPSLPRYALLLNPDTIVPPTTLVAMIDFMDVHPECGVAGPRVRRLDGSLDKACRRSFPTPRVSLYRMIGLSTLFPGSRRWNAYNLEYLPEEGVYPVDAVVGAYMQVRGEAIRRVGLLDAGFFMYGEDLDWAKRVKDAGWQVWYNGHSQITHVKEAASRRSGRARVAFYAAMWLFYRKHYRQQTTWWLDKAILMGIGLRGGVDVIRHLWRTYRRPEGSA